MTLSFNPAALSEKSNAGAFADSELFARINEELAGVESLSAEQKEYYLLLLKNPAETGVDMDRDSYMFFTLEGENPAQPTGRGGLLLPLADRAKFDALSRRSMRRAVWRSSSPGRSAMCVWASSRT